MDVAKSGATMSEKKLSPHWLTFALLLPALACGDDPTETNPSEASSEGSGEGSGGASSGTEGEDPPTDESTSASGESTDGAVEDDCGNGVVDPGEICDDGELNGNAGACTANCQGRLVVCGDGLVQGGEACDDGNAKDGDGCNSDCRVSGAIVWEHPLGYDGRAYGVDVGADGTLYVAGSISGAYTTAWAAGLSGADGAVEWTYELPPTNGAASNVFRDVTTGRGGELVLGGQHNGVGRVAVLDAAGMHMQNLPPPNGLSIGWLAVLPDGDYLASHGASVSRFHGLVQDWQTAVAGPALTYRAGDNIALVAIPDAASFQRLTLDGVAYEPVVFEVPEELHATSREVARTSNGDVVVAGTVFEGGHGEALVIRSSLDGNPRWMYGPEQLHQQFRQVRCLAVDSQDSIIVGGYAYVLGERRPLVMKLSPEGEVLWVRSLEFAAVDADVLDCTTTANDEVVAVGDANGQVWAAKLTP